MKTLAKRGSAMLLSLSLLLGMVPVYAAEPTETNEASEISFSTHENLYALETTESVVLSVNAPEGSTVYYTLDGQDPNTTSSQAENNQITVSKPTATDGGIVTVKAVAVTDGEENTSNSDTITTNISFYRTTLNSNDVMSLAIGESTYYFSSVETAFSAIDDENLSGAATFTVLENATYTTDTVYLFSKASGQVTIDLKGNNLTISGNGSKALIYLQAPAVVLTDSTATGNAYSKSGEEVSNGLNGGSLLLENAILYYKDVSNGILQIKNISITQNTSTSSTLLTATGVEKIEVSNSYLAKTSGGSTQVVQMGATEIAINNSVILESSASNGLNITAGTASIVNSYIKGTKSSGVAYAALYVNGGTVTVEDVSLNGTYEMWAKGSSTSYAKIIVKSGTYQGKFKSNTSNSAIEIQAGNFVTDPVNGSTITAPNTTRTEETIDGTTYIKYAQRSATTANVTLNAAEGAATLNQETGSNVTVYEQEKTQYTVTCLDGYEVKEIIYQNQTIDLNTDANYTAEGNVYTYTVTVPTGGFSLTITVGEKTGQAGIVKVTNSTSEKEYSTLSQALLSLQDGDTLILQDSFTYTSAIDITKKNITLDLNGKTLTLDVPKQSTTSDLNIWSILVSSDAGLTVTDTSEDAAGSISFSQKSGVRLEGENAAFTLNNGTLKDINYTNSDSTSIYNLSQNSKVTINDGRIEGRIYANAAGSQLEINGGELTVAEMPQAIYLTLGSAVINGGTIYASGDKTEMPVLRPLAGANRSSDEPVLTINGGTIINESDNPTISVFAGVTGTVNITGGDITSTKTSVLSVEGRENTMARTCTVNISGGTMTGATYAIEFDDSAFTNMPSVVITGGSFNNGDDYLPISDTYYVTFPDADQDGTPDSVLNKEKNTEGYYTLIEIGELKGTYEPSKESGQSNVDYTYQDFDGLSDGSNSGLRQLVASAKEIYEANTGSSAGDAWAPFVRAYTLANRLIESNKNANQMEINFRGEALSDSILALEVAANLDINALSDGTYTIQAVLWKSTLNALSMSNGALDPTATLTLKTVDGERTATLALNFGPTFQYLTYGHLEDFYIYTGTDANEVKPYAYASAAEADAANRRELAKPSNWYKDSGNGVKVLATEENQPDEQKDPYLYPGTVEFQLPYWGTSDALRSYWVGMNVDAMGGYASAILMLSWSTLQLQKSDGDALSVPSTEVTISLRSDTKTSELPISVLGSGEYTLSASSSDETVAKATIENNMLKIEGLKEGTAKVTISAVATNDENTALESVTIDVTVSDAETIKATTSADGDTAKTEMTGEVLVSSEEDNVEASNKNVTVDATSETSEETEITTAVVTIPASVSTGLKGYTTTIQTDVGDVTIDSTLMGQVAETNSQVTLTIEKQANALAGYYNTAYEISLTDANGKAVNFGSGKAIVTVPCSEAVQYAYYLNDSNQVKERITATYDSTAKTATWYTSHFSLWALSAKEIATMDEGNTSVPPVEETYFLDDGNYYVDVYLWKDTSNEASMGDVAFKNNRKALVTVKSGEITTVQVATNPVDVPSNNVTYHSAITSVTGVDCTVTVESEGKMTTKPEGKEYNYVRLFSFTMPSSGQPTLSNERTYVKIQFNVPDTPMGSDDLNAKLRFDWSTAKATKDTKLTPDDTTARGTDPTTGEIVSDVELIDKNTGIEVSTTTQVLSDKAVLSVTKPTSGTDYDTAVKALSSLSDSWTLYKIVATVSGKETAPDGSVTVSIPCGSDGLTVYRINADGSRTSIKGSVKNGYYVFSTSSLGLFAVIGEVNEITLLEDISDTTTGIRLTATEDIFPDGITLKVTPVTSGSAYNQAQSAVGSQTEKFAVYTVTVVNSRGVEVTPTGSFTLSFPIPTDYATNRMAVYRLVDAAAPAGSASAVLLSGTVSASGKTYTVETNTLGTFVVAERTSSVLDRFTDLDGHWARDYIAVAVEQGLFAGTSDTTFSPDESMTRGMFVTVLGRLAQADTSTTATRFTDVKDSDYYAPYVAWAAENGIVQGATPTTFEPERAVSREEMATLLDRYCQFVQITLDSSKSVTFTDEAAISGYAKASVQAMAAAGLLVGTDKGAFEPQGTATRAEVATLLARFVQNYSL